MKFLRKLYIKFLNKLHHNLEPLKDSYEYVVSSKYQGCNLSIFNPVECIYFALSEVYGDHLPQLKIQGVRADYSVEDRIIIHIHTVRPGLIIGLRGRDIDLLTSVLFRYFGKTIEIKLTEEKDLNYVFTRIL